MVLKFLDRRRIQLILLCIFVSACSSLQKTDDANSAPETKVVPATIDQSEPASSTEQQLQASEPLPESQPALNEGIPDKPQALKKNEILATILLQARKAIDNQQWLRAQHHLEHALRLSPQHAQSFYLYALVYLGMGVPEQATQMLKRALFLSRPESELHETVKLKLESIEN